MTLTDDAERRECPSPTAHGKPGQVSARASRSPRKSDGGAGGSETLMQEFVHMHMMSILRPFVEQIRELQTVVEQLGVKASKTCMEVGKQRDQLGHHESQLFQLGATTSDLDTRLEVTREELRAVGCKSDECAAEIGKTKASLSKAEEKLWATCADVEAGRAAQFDAGIDVQKLQSGLADVDKRLSEHVETRLNNLHKFCKDINAQQAEHLAALQQTKVFAESNQQALKQFAARVEKRHDEDMEKIDCLHQHAKGFEAKLSLHGREMQRQNDALKHHDKEFQRLGAEFGNLMTFQQVHVNHSELFLSLKEANSRMVKVEEDILQLKSDSASDFQRVDSQLRMVQGKLEESASDIQSLRSDQENNSAQFRGTGQLLRDMEHAHAKLGRRADALAEDVQSLTFWQQDAAGKLEEQGSSSQQVLNELEHVKQGLETTGFDVDGLRQELGVTHKGLSKLDSRLDVVQKYFTGFGKGLQETNRQVACEGGALPAKAGFNLTQAGLPVIPGTPRGSLSPRRRRLPSKPPGPCSATHM